MHVHAARPAGRPGRSPAAELEPEAMRLLTAAEVGALVGRSDRWARRLISAGVTDPRGLRSVVIGRDGHGRPVRRVRVDDWNAFVDALDGRTPAAGTSTSRRA